MKDTLKAALEYAELGFRVLPLQPGTKIPDLRHWPEEASTDPDAIRRFWDLSRRRGHQHEGQPNVGICTGGALAVLDVDTNHGGEVPSWVPKSTWTVKTPSGGLHFYLAVTEPVPNSVGRLAPGIDVRGERGQVAAPPSLVVSRAGQPVGTYRWVNDKPIQPIDAQLLIPEDQKKDFTGVRRVFEYQDDVPIGGRNNYLTALAGYLFAGGNSASEVLQALRDEVNALDFHPREGEVESIVRSIGRYHV